MILARLHFTRFKLEDRIIFAKHLSIMLKSGLTISEAMEIVVAQSQGRVKEVLKEVRALVVSGNSLSDALAKYPRIFNTLFINSVRAGESSGTLEQNLEGIASHLEKDKELNEKIRSAMFYPAVVLALAAAMGIGISFFVLPKITPMFEGLGIDLPITTRWLIAFSKMIQEDGVMALISLLIGAAAAIFMLKQEFMRPLLHWLFIKLPIIRNISRQRNLAVFCSTLGTLLKSGLSIDQSMAITSATVSNYHFQKTLKAVGNNIMSGAKLSDNLAENKDLFPEICVGMIMVGERSGRLEETLAYLSGYYESEVNISTKKLSAAIEPILLILIGLVVGGLAISIITPIYKITGGVR